MADDIEAELLTLGGFAVVLAGHGHQCFGETDEANGQCAVFDDIAKLVVRAEFIAANPVTLPHQEREVFDFLIGLEFETL